MVCSPAELNALPAESYRRQARRLRALFPHDLHRLQNSLVGLAKREDARQRILTSVAAKTRARPSVVCRVVHPGSLESGAAVDRFASLVESEIQAGVLRHSRRMALLRRAKQLGISRFDASLIIASVQHRFDEPHRPSILSSTPSSRRYKRFASMWMLFIVLAIEIPIVVAAWKILHP